MTEILRDDYGYEGSVDLVRKRLAELRPEGERAAQRTGYRPGQVMQVDWAEMPTRPRIAGSRAPGLRAGLLVAVLGGVDGALHVRHDDRVVSAGSRPRVRLAGRRSARVRLRQPPLGGRAPRARRRSEVVHWNPRFSQLRGHYAFHAHACTPETPREKGSVEGGGPLPQDRVLAGPALRGSAPSSTRSTRGWRDRVALPRRHATGRHIVAERLQDEREQLRALPPVDFDAAGRRSSRVPLDGYLSSAAASTARPEQLVHQRVELRWDRDRVWIEHHGQPRRRLRAQLRARRLAAARRGCARAAAGRAADRDRRPGRRSAGAERLRRALRMSPKTKRAAVGERLPYLLAKLKAPRVLERLEQTAATAREEGWPYEQFLETLLEAEVFARDASGARNRIRHAAFPAHKTPGGLRLHRPARRREAADLAPRAARLDRPST